VPTLNKPVLVTYKIKDHIFDVLQRYEIQYKKPLGEGSYGTICSAWDTEEEIFVAIKKNRNVFSFDNWYQKRIYRELRILKHLDHECIINLIDLIPPKNYEEFNDVYLVTEKMETDLRKIIESNQEITDEHIQYFLHQILCGLKYIHSANILHRDLKPENILINSDCSVKICDFGLSRAFDFENDNPVMSTPYVATRWYRAPELLLQSRHADRGMDIWSVGCIFAELLTRRPIFPGKNYLDQLNLIIRILGTPNISNIACEPSARQYIESIPYVHKKPLNGIIKNASPEALDLLERMLAFDPSERITIEDALHHPYLRELTITEEVDSDICSEVFDFGEEKDATDIKALIYREVMDWNREENGLVGDAHSIPSKPRLNVYRLVNLNQNALIMIPPRYSIPHEQTGSTKLVHRKREDRLMIVGVDNVYERPVVVHHFPNVTASEEACKRVFTMILALQHIGGHNNILSLVDLVPPVNYDQFRDVYIVTEYLEFTMQTLLKSSYKFIESSSMVVIYQVCLGVLYMHSSKLCHRNLHPAAIFVDKNLNVKLAEFKMVNEVNIHNLESLWCKAPELILGYTSPLYDEAQDVWSIGALMAQTLNGNQPIFNGSDTSELLRSMIRVLGVPSMERKDFPQVTPPNVIQYFASMQNEPQIRGGLQGVLPKASPKAIDLIKGMLTWNPVDRLTINDVVNHPFFVKFSHLGKTVHKSAFSFKTPDSNYKQMLYSLIMVTAQRSNGCMGDSSVNPQVINLPHVEES